MSWVKQQQVCAWAGPALVYWSRKLVFVLVPVNGCTSSPVQSCIATRILHHAANGSYLSSPFSSQTNQSETEPLLFALSESVFLPPLSGLWTHFRRPSSTALSTCIARCCGRPFSATYLPATPSACPLGANSIRRPGFPPQSNHPIKTLLPQITPLHFRDMAPDSPFQVPLDCRPFTQDAALPTMKLFVTHNFFADKRL